MLVARRETDSSLGARSRTTAPAHAYLVSPAIALVSLAITLAVGSYYGMGLRDPDGVVGVRLLGVLALVGAFWALDIVPRAVRRARAGDGGVLRAARAVASERWGWKRVAIVIGTIAAFYLTYLCYRNLKSYVPLVDPGLQDATLLQFERDLFGADPAVVLHDLLGTGLSAHVLSTVYVLFLTFVPVSVGIALVWTDDQATGLWWAAALSLNWILGALSYFLIPALGPVFVSPGMFADLPYTATTGLQEMLREDRATFLADPVGSGGLQSVAAFASLHVSVVLTGALCAHLLQAPRPLRIGLWVFLGLTSLATVYFGWHYVVDGLGGVAIAVVAVGVAARLTGWRIEMRRAWRLEPSSAPVR